MFTDEKWERVRSAVDAHGRPVVFIARRRNAGYPRLTIWRLVKHRNGWYSSGQWISKRVWRNFPESAGKGVKLSDSPTDRRLLALATAP